MRWDTIKGLSNRSLQRLVGVKRVTFERMVAVVQEQKSLKRKHVSKGRPAKLCIEDELLMPLMYYREYRSFFHIGVSYGISETQCWRIVTKMESLLIGSRAFSLKGKKQLYEQQQQALIVVDVSEHSIERPKKSKEVIIRVKRKSIP
jgi:hypothetical protein